MPSRSPATLAGCLGATMGSMCHIGEMRESVNYMVNLSWFSRRSSVVAIAVGPRQRSLMRIEVAILDNIGIGCLNLQLWHPCTLPHRNGGVFQNAVISLMPSKVEKLMSRRPSSCGKCEVPRPERLGAQMLQASLKGASLDEQELRPLMSSDFWDTVRIWALRNPCKIWTADNLDNLVHSVQIILTCRIACAILFLTLAYPSVGVWLGVTVPFRKPRCSSL